MALTEITKGMSNAAEAINDNFKSINEYTYDTGDKDLMPFITNGYESNIDDSNKYRKIGKQVQLIFNVTNLKIGIVPGSEEAEVCFVLPEELRPTVGFSLLARTNGTMGKRRKSNRNSKI